MKKDVVMDSSCLIKFRKLGHLAILPELFATVLISPVVKDELTVQSEYADIWQKIFDSSPWLKIQEFSDQLLFEKLKTMVDKGEAGCIVQALELKCLFFTDDNKGRKLAEKMGLEVHGTFQILDVANEKGVLSCFDYEQIFVVLKNKNDKNKFYLSQKVIDYFFTKFEKRCKNQNR